MFLFCCLGGWLGFFQYCGTYLPFIYFVCHFNNRALDKDTNTIIKRVEYIQWRVDKGNYEI